MGLFVEIVVLVAALASVLAHFAGYQLMLALARVLRPRPLTCEPAPGPEPVWVIVCTYNEERLVRKKLLNLEGLERIEPAPHVVLVDGGSTDDTLSIARATAAEINLDVTIIEGPRGKIPQLNAALAVVPEEAIVVITDADAVIDNVDALERTRAYLRQPDIGLVGGWTRPPEDMRAVWGAEQGFWDKQNRLRYAETVSFSSSIVVAPYYAFRRSELDGFPELCIADDVYASFCFHTKERRVIYAPDILVTELRHPETLGALFKHKLRKANAYTVELLRFAHLLPYMGRRLKLVYVFKLMQFFYLPWSVLVLAGVLLHLLFIGQLALVAGVVVVCVGFIGLASASMVPAPSHSRGGLRLESVPPSLLIFVVMTVVLMLNTFLFPFWRQSSSYARLDSKEEATSWPRERAS